MQLVFLRREALFKKFQPTLLQAESSNCRENAGEPFQSTGQPFSQRAQSRGKIESRFAHTFCFSVVLPNCMWKDMHFPRRVPSGRKKPNLFSPVHPLPFSHELASVGGKNYSRSPPSFSQHLSRAQVANVIHHTIKTCRMWRTEIRVAGRLKQIYLTGH